MYSGLVSAVLLEQSKDLRDGTWISAYVALSSNWVVDA